MAKKNNTAKKKSATITSRKSNAVPKGQLVTRTKGKKTRVELLDRNGKIKGSSRNY